MVYVDFLKDNQMKFEKNEKKLKNQFLANQIKWLNW
jgi:hypothetical protein